MKKTISFAIITLCLLFLFNGCTLKTTGNSLYAFSERLNEIYETDTFNEVGYIVDQSNCTLTQFYKFNLKEIMLQFTYNEKNELTKMDLTFKNDVIENSDCYNFIKNCLTAYINDEKTESEILTDIDFNNTLSKTDINTKTSKIGDIEMLIDTTEIGTVITVVQNTL